MRRLLLREPAAEALSIDLRRLLDFDFDFDFDSDFDFDFRLGDDGDDVSIADVDCHKASLSCDLMLFDRREEDR